jgi:hypothetical protein
MEEIFYMPHEKYNPHELLFTYEDMMDMFTKWDEENPDDQVHQRSNGRQQLV